MYFDALTLAAVVSELRATLLGGRVQRVVLPSSLSVALEIYAQGRRWHLLLSVHPQFARVHLSTAKPSRNVERDTPFLLLLRKYVVGGRIIAIDQPELERVLVLSIAKGVLTRNTGTSPSPDEGYPAEQEEVEWETEEVAEVSRCELIIEAMERLGNIVLVGDDNIIKESARHVTPRMSRRPVQPHEPYELPPRQEKRDPRKASAEGVSSLLGLEQRDLARALVAAYRGLSPLAAREAVFRATGRTAVEIAPDLPWEALADAIRALWVDPWDPCLAVEDSVPSAFAPYRLTHMSHVEPQPSINVALDRFYTLRDQLTDHRQRRELVRRQLEEAAERMARQRRLLQEELARASELDRLRWEGEMIYAFMHTLAPGQTTLEVEGRTIVLTAGRTPVENAQERFRAYDKAKSALAGLPQRLQEVEARLAGLEEMAVMLELAEGFEQIEGIAREAIEQGYIAKPSTPQLRPKAGRQQPLRVMSSDGYTICIGRSAAQNELVTFKLGGPDDLWLHARGVPGAHVIIKSGGRSVSEQTVREAAALAAYFSKHRNESAVDVDLARRSRVRHVPNGPAGLVSYQAERTIRVAPRKPADSTS